MVIRWKVARMQYDFDVTHISGVKNILADLLSRLVRNHLEEITPKEELKELNNEILTDDVYNKIKAVYNSTAGHAGVERTVVRLQAKDHRLALRENSCTTLHQAMRLQSKDERRQNTHLGSPLHSLFLPTHG